MNHSKFVWFAIVVMLFVSILTACMTQSSNHPVNPPNQPIGMANLASVYCQGLGYREETRNNVKGESGVCIFPDGTMCPELDFFQGSCGLENPTPPAEERENINELEINVLEQDAALQGVPVTGWLGAVYSLSEGGQYDDYVVLAPEQAGSFGIRSENQEIEKQITNLRDHSEPGKYANFWGSLTCEVPDYNGCQLVVSHLRVGTQISGPEPVENLIGKIYSHPAGTQFDDFFVLNGDYPIQFGIAPGIGVDGSTIMEEEIRAFRDSEKNVRITGQMRCGVPDTNGCQIQVSDIQIYDE
jgi:putative hemolysin